MYKLNKSNFILKKRSINGSNNSFNSLLDNVALDASQIYDETTNNKNNQDIENEDEYNINNNETQVHSMFTSRTYIKVTNLFYNAYFLNTLMNVCM